MHQIFTQLTNSLAGFLLLCCLAAVAGAEQTAQSKVLPGDGEQDISAYLTFYYQRPDPARIPELIDFCGKAVGEKPSALGGAMGFLAGIFHHNPQHLQQWRKEVNFKDSATRKVFLLGLWHADSREAKRQANIFLLQHPDLKFLVKGRKMQPFIGVPIDHPMVLDALWGDFMATGEAAPVERIIAVLPWAWQYDPGNNPQDTQRYRQLDFRFMIGGAAQWSLASNARQHPRVLAICETARGKTSDTKLADALTKIITSTKAKNP